jgi:beta-glucanase (GH16 family)
MNDKMHHKAIMALLCLLLLTLYAADIRAQGPEIVWADEFEDPAIDRTSWSFEVGPTFETLHYYTDRAANAKIVDGKLQIIALKESYQGFNYTSALLKTQNAYYWRYGRIEARIKLPRTTGFVPAFWMLSQDGLYGWWPWCGEIDIMEHPTNQDKIFGTCHTYKYSYFTGTMNPAGGSIQVPDSETEFHVYKVQWTPEKIDFYVDDQNYFTFNNEYAGFEAWPFDQPFYLILGMGVGGGWVGNPDATTVFPGVMEVDYVRVFQNVQDVSIFGPDDVLQGSKALSYYAPSYEDVQYLWSVPNTAKITSGQGTPRIAVDWGFYSGTVDLTLVTLFGPQFMRYPVKASNNLLKNSGFEKGAKYWNKVGNYPAEAVFTVSTLYQHAHTGDRALAVDVKKPGVNAWDVQLSQTNLSLKSGQTYHAGFWARSETNSSITAAVINSSTYLLYGSMTFQLTNAWSQCDFSFQAPGNATGSFNIDMGGHTGRYVFDDMQLTIPEQDDQNQLKNPDFSSRMDEWVFNSFPPAVANASEWYQEVYVSIENGGVNPWDVYFGQSGLMIEKGKEYTVSFDAFAEAPRQISPLVGRNSDPWTVYSGSNPIVLTTERQTFSYSFVMQDPTDSQARLGFDLGGSSEDVFLDNIFLSQGRWSTSVAAQGGQAPRSLKYFQNTPNPFNQSTMITFDLPEESFVTLAVYDLNGRLVDTPLESRQSAGVHSIRWNGNPHASGLYFLKISTSFCSRVNRMLLIK